MAEERVIRILLAEDSATVRHHLTRLINEVSGLRVVGEARDGREAVEMVAALKPDVVSMDIRMPLMDGLEATRQIMARWPTPIVVVSGLLDDDVDLSFKALEAGALAVVEKPGARGGPAFAAQQRQLTHTLIAMAGVKVVRRWERAPGQNGTRRQIVQSVAVSPRAGPELVAIGASAGGPSALSILLRQLGADIPFPLAIVQHMPDEFIAGLARWLTKSAGLPVMIAADGQPLLSGAAYLSPGSAHLTVARMGGRLVARLIAEQGAHRYQPSVDVLFHSAAAVCGEAAVGVLLTGMGDDGAAGLLAVRQAGGRTFAQDRLSCTVFGMPAAAIERGAVEQVLPLDELSAALRRLLE